MRKNKSFQDSELELLKHGLRVSIVGRAIEIQTKSSTPSSTPLVKLFTISDLATFTAGVRNGLRLAASINHQTH